MSLDPESLAVGGGVGGVVTVVLGSIALAYNRMFGAPEKRMEFELRRNGQKAELELKRDQQEHEQEVTVTQIAFDALAKRVDGLDALIQSQAKTIASQSQQIVSLTDQLGREHLDAKAAREQIANLQDEVAKLRKELSEAAFTHASDQQTIAALRSDLEQAREQIARLQQRVQELEDLERQHQAAAEKAKAAAKKKAKARKSK